MAGELTTSAAIAFEKAGRRVTMNFSNVVLDVTGSNFVRMTASVGITEQVLDLGSIATAGLMLIRNLSGTTVNVRNAGGSNTIRIGPGAFAVFQPSSLATVRLIADSADAKVEYLAIEA